MAKDRRDQSSPSRQYALTAAPLVIGAVALYGWAVSPHVGYLHAMQRLQPILEKMAGELDTISESLDDKLSTMRTLQREVAKTREVLFTPEESAAFVRDLQALVQTSGCAMVAAEFTRDEDARTAEDPNAVVRVETSHADLTVVGSYEQVVSLLRTFRERRQKVWVDSCDLTVVDPGHTRLECQLGLTLYAVLESGELPQ